MIPDLTILFYISVSIVLLFNLVNFCFYGYSTILNGLYRYALHHNTERFGSGHILRDFK